MKKRTKRIIITSAVLIPLLMIGYVVCSMMELRWTDKLEVGYMYMEGNGINSVSTHFHKSDPPIDGYNLLSIFHRWRNSSQILQTLVVTDSSGKTVKTLTWHTDDYYDQYSLNELQEKTGTFHLIWYWNHEVIAESDLTIDEK